MRRTRSSLTARRHWCTAQCSESTGTISAPGVDRDPLHDGTGCDQRFLVGEGQAPTGLQGGQGHREPGEADHAIDDDVGMTGDLGQGVGPDQHLDAGRDPAGQLAGPSRIGDGDLERAQLHRLLDQPVDRRRRPDRDDPVVPRLGPDDIDGLGADRSRRTNQADRLHAAIRSAEEVT